MSKKIVILPGDGIGYEVISQALKVLNAVSVKHNLQIVIEQDEIGVASYKKTGELLTSKTLEKCINADAVLMGAVGDPEYSEKGLKPETSILELRKAMGVYANIRPINTFKGIENKYLKLQEEKDINFVIYRELTGGIYFGEKKREKDFASDLCIYSVEEIERITHKACKAALSRRKKLTLIDKANVLETSRLWRETVRNIVKQYPDITYDEQYVDSAAMKIIMDPYFFDVIVTENMFGDIISDEASVISGSLGLLPSASVGNANALFEPVHGSYPQAKGLDKANPVASILCIAMMMEYFGYDAAAKDVREAVLWAIQNKISTEDIEFEKPFSCSLVGNLIACRVEDGKDFIISTSKLDELSSHCILM